MNAQYRCDPATANRRVADRTILTGLENNQDPRSVPLRITISENTKPYRSLGSVDVNAILIDGAVHLPTISLPKLSI